MLLSFGPEDAAVEPEPAPTAAAVLLSLGPAAGRVPTAAATLLSEGPLSLRVAGCALAPAAEVLSEEFPSLSARTRTTAAAATSVSSAASQSDRLDMCIAGIDRWGCACWDMGPPEVVMSE
jgi:hypothetical protein